MRSSSQAALPRSSRLPAQAAHPAPRRPVQLDLFGRHQPPSPAPPQERAPARPVVVPSPDAPRLALQRALNRLTGGRLKSLTLTENRRTILSVRRGGDRTQLAVRIHRCFLEASPEVLEAVAAFLESKKGTERARQSLLVIRRHFSEQAGEPARARRPRRPALDPVGVAVDLREIADDLNQRFFAGRLSAGITWGRGTATGHACRRGTRTSSLQLGCYSYEDNLIRLHRVLDRPDIPRYVLEAVIFHELLHADMPPVVRNGRRYFHTAEFRGRERTYRQLDKANRWIAEHLAELLRARRRPRA